MDVVLSLTHVCRAFEGCAKPALEGVTFAVKRGELVAIVGPAYSGKSVLLDIVAGLDEPTSGLVYVAPVDGSPVGAATTTTHRRRCIALLGASRPGIVTTAQAGHHLLLLADEPEEGALAALLAAHRGGQTTIFATRDLDLALANAGHVVQLDRGRLVRDGDAGLFRRD